jgi:hypothetical protein
MTSSFSHPQIPQMSNSPVRELLKGYRNSWFHILGRLKPGTNLEQAQANLNVVLQRLLKGPMGDETLFTDRQSLQKLRIEVAQDQHEITGHWSNS